MEILFGHDGSQKFQLHPVIFPDEMVVKSLKQVGLPKHTVVELKFANGSGFKVTGIEIVSLHPFASITMSVAV